MTRLLVLSAAGLLLVSCATQEAGTCAEYESQVRDLLERDVSGDQIEVFLTETEQVVARLIAEQPERADACVTAILEATFAAGFAELESLLEN